jgi:hypothetical protein
VLSGSEIFNIFHAMPPKISETYAKLSRDAINALPLFHYGGRITLVRTPDDLSEAVDRLREETVLGFDTETPPCFRKGKTHAPTLVQLAGAEEVVLFHLKWQPLNSVLVSLFEEPSIVKTGVAVHDDMRSLARVTPFTPRSVVDLSEIARRNNIENRGLRGLAAAFLGLRISKREQCSNWGNRELSPRQIRYAATDAWASRAAYITMREAGLDVAYDAAPVRHRRTKNAQADRRGNNRPIKCAL